MVKHLEAQQDYKYSFSIDGKQLVFEFLSPANEVWGKVMFLHLSVILFTGREGGWLQSMHHRSHDQHPRDRGGGLHQGVLGTPPARTRKAGTTHPTGMLPCFS